MILTVCAILIGIAYLIVNIITAYRMSPKEMKQAFVEGQCTVGKIASAIFYAPAWFLKVLKVGIIRGIK